VPLRPENYLVSIADFTVSKSLSSMSVLVNLTAFSRITIHNLIRLSPNSESSGILFTASDTILDAKGSRKDNIIKIQILPYIGYFSLV